jgi:hypothetical protein
MRAGPLHIDQRSPAPGRQPVAHLPAIPVGSVEFAQAHARASGGPPTQAPVNASYTFVLVNPELTAGKLGIARHLRMAGFEVVTEGGRGKRDKQSPRSSLRLLA